MPPLEPDETQEARSLLFQMGVPDLHLWELGLECESPGGRGQQGPPPPPKHTHRGSQGKSAGTFKEMFATDSMAAHLGPERGPVSCREQALKRKKLDALSPTRPG